MGILTTFLSEQIIERIGWVLLHSLWQGCAIMILTWVALKILTKASSNSRYVIACVGLGLMVLAPIVTFMIIKDNSVSPVAEVAVVKPVVDSLPQVNIETKIVTTHPEPSVPPKRSLLNVLNSRLQTVLPYCVTGWLVGVAALSLWYLGGWCQLQRLRRIGTKTVSEALTEKTSRLAHQLGICKALHIVESALVRVPTVIGHLKPVILLPATALTGLDEIQLQAMIAHELAHIKRCDYLMNIFQTVIEILGFYHPAVWWTSRQVRIERENCCDDIAIGLLQNRKEYAKALFSMEAIRNKQLSLAVAANGAPLTNRISRLAEKNTPPHTNSGWIPTAVIIGLLIILISTVAFTAQTPSKAADKILQFPTEYSLGDIFVQDVGYQRKLEHTFWANEGPWDYIGPAKGTIIVPPAKRVKLIVHAESWQQPEKLKALNALHPDDIDHLVLSGTWAQPGTAPPTDACIPYVTHLTGLRVLNLNQSHITKRGLKSLSLLNHLESLYLPAGLTNGGLAEVAKIKSLKSLYFDQNQVTDRALELLQTLPDLSELALCGDKLSNEGLKYVAELSSLNYLFLWPPFSDEGLQYLRTCPNLKILYLNNLENLTDKGVQYVSRIQSLQTFSAHFQNQITDKGVGYLANLPYLKTVDLYHASLTDQALKTLSQMKTLESLTLPFQGLTDSGVQSLAKLPNLKELMLCSSSQSPLTDTSLKALSSVPTLETLNIAGIGFTDEGMSSVSQLTNLRELNLFSAPEVTDQGIAKLSPLTYLERLSLPRNSKMTFHGLNQLNTLKNLKYITCDTIHRGTDTLNISGMTNLVDLRLGLPRTYSKENNYAANYQESFTDNDLTCLSGITNLQHLALSGSGIGDKGLSYLEDLVNLQAIFLNGDLNITDDGLKYLSKMQKLARLDISKGNFTDNALQNFPNLESLSSLNLISENYFSKEAMTQFRNSHPAIQQLQLSNDLKKNNNGFGGMVPPAQKGDGSEKTLEDDSLESMNHLRQLGLAWFMYKDDHDGDRPDELEDLHAYLNDETFQWLGKNAVLLNVWDDIVDSTKTPIAYDKTFLEKYNRRIVAFADGHAEIDSNDGLKELLDEARRISNRVERMHQLKSFGLELTLWAYDHEDVFPDSIEQIEFEDADLKEWAMENVEYLAAGIALSEIEDADKEVIAYDKNLSKTDNGTTLLFADGHVEFRKKENIKAIFELTDSITSPPAMGGGFGDGIGGFGGAPPAGEIRFPENWDEMVEKQNKKRGIDPTAMEKAAQVEQVIRKQLSTTIDYSSLTEESTIEEAIDLMRSSVSPPLSIVVLWGDLSENAFIEKDQPIGVDGLGVTKLETGLRTIMLSLSASEISDIDYMIEDGMIVIASQKSLPKEYRTQIYDVADILHYPGTGKKAAKDIEGLTQIIIQSVSPSSWSENGGQGRIDHYVDEKLIIYQTPQVHARLQTYFKNLRDDLFKYQVAIEARFMYVDNKFFEDADVEITQPDHIVGQVTEGLANSNEIKAALETKPLDERTLPFDNFQTLDDLQVSFLIKGAQSRTSVKTLTAPKVAVLNGESACMQIQSQLTYIDVDDEQKFIQTGITFDILPVIQNNGKEVLLKGHAVISDILENNPETPDDIPTMQIAKILIHTVAENTGTLLIIGPNLKDPETGQTRHLLILITPTVIESEESPASPPAGGMMGGYGIGGFGGGGMMGGMRYQSPEKTEK